MQRLSKAVAHAAIVLALSCFSLSQSYSIRDLGTLGGRGGSQPYGLNDRGEVCGISATTTTSDAFLWTKSGGMQDLGTLGGFSFGNGVNVSGDVVGSSDTTSGVHAFFWSSGTGMQDIGSLGGASYGTAINASGQVAGYSSLSTPGQHAFLWSASAGMQDLGTLSSTGQGFSTAQAINKSAQVVGYSGVGGGAQFHAFLWTESAGMSDLGTLGGSDSQANGINDSGQVVGDAMAADQLFHAFLWTKAAGMRSLGTLGGTTSHAAAINNHGQIVGSAPMPGTDVHPFLWTRTGGMQDLTTLIPANTHWVLWAAPAINNFGQITLPATLGSGNTPHALLLTPLMTTSLVSSSNPSVVGQAVTFKATVRSIAGAPPSGETVTFTNGANVLGTGTLSKGVAQLTRSSLTVGTHNIHATYAGDVIYASSRSAVLVQVVNR